MLHDTHRIIRSALALDPMPDARKKQIMRAIQKAESGQQTRQRISGRQARLILGLSSATWKRRRNDFDAYTRLTTMREGATEYFYLDEIEAIRDGASK
jgi:hypothetical protein